MKRMTFAEYSPEAYAIDGLRLETVETVRERVLAMRDTYTPEWRRFPPWRKLPLVRPFKEAEREQVEYVRYCQLFDAMDKFDDTNLLKNYDGMDALARRLVEAMRKRRITKLEDCLLLRVADLMVYPRIGRESVDSFDAYWIGGAK